MNLFTRRLLAGLLAVGAFAAGLTAAQAAGPATPAHPPKPPFPQITLPEAKSGGQRAIDLLGDRLPEVAAWYRKSPDEFAAMLLTDRMLKIDRRGRLFVEDELDRVLPAGPKTNAATPGAPAAGALPRTGGALAMAGAPSPGLLDGSLAPLDQTFALHSRPGAKRTIYLNFRGAVLSNTAWNSAGTTITAQPFDIDGVPNAFSTTELQRIQYIWQRVAEDYAPMDVDVTTEAPAADLITRSSGTDDVFGTMVLITQSTGVYSCSCGGVAYVGIFDDTTDYYKPALVFYDKLGSGHEKYVAEAISHEAGHNVGLAHDGYSGGAYYGGQGSGVTGWAPIMGVGYDRALVQWSKGEYATANNVQDDFLVMAATGLPPRTDDHGNDAASATALTGTVSNGVASLRAEGVIESAQDVDVFSFTASAGSASFTLAPAARSPNLDAVIELRDAAGNLLASANPLEELGATLTATLPAAGTYTVWVRGTGKGDPLTTGYTAYGSVGQYALTGTAPVASGLPPVVALGATPTQGVAPLTVNFSAAGSSDPDGSIVGYAWAFGDGGTASGATASHVYTTAGSYNAQLVVTDNSGLSSARSVTITVTAPVVVLPMRVADIAMSLKVAKNGQARATAVVTVRDGNGAVVPGATVSGRWSGLTSGSASVVTGSNGTASFSSANSRASGTFVFSVTGVTLTGYSYQPALNTETSDSITR